MSLDMNKADGYANTLGKGQDCKPTPGKRWKMAEGMQPNASFENNRLNLDKEFASSTGSNDNPPNKAITPTAGSTNNNAKLASRNGGVIPANNLTNKNNKKMHTPIKFQHSFDSAMAEAGATQAPLTRQEAPRHFAHNNSSNNPHQLFAKLPHQHA